MTPLAVTSLTLTSCLGAGLRPHADALLNLRSGLTRCNFETAQLDTWIGRIPDEQLAPVRGRLATFDCRNNRLAQLGLTADGFEQAVALARARYGARRIGVILGTSTSGILQTEIAYRFRDPATGALPADFNYAGTQSTFSLGAFVQAHLELEGPASVVSTACSSSAKAFGAASRMIAVGLCDAAVVGGVDSLCLTTLYGFGSLELLSPEPCRPFDVERGGISIGEGAGFALLEPASANDHKDTIQLLGVGESSDGYHMSSPHPDGAGARLAMERALTAAGLTPSDIDYINLHGTGTRSNDSAEEKAVFSLFGASTPCSSTKGMTGHLLGAAGIAEAIICALALHEQCMPGSANTRIVDPGLRLRYLRETVRQAPQRVVSNSFGFGGSNCSLVFGRAQ